MMIHGIDTSRLNVCARCGGLLGEHPFGGDTCTVYCHCAAVGTRESVVLPPGLEALPAIDLCACCALTPVPAGTGDADLFCRECRDLITTINTESGEALVPVMRGRFLKTGRPPDPRWRPEVYNHRDEKLFDIADRIDVVLEWRRMIVLRTLTVLQLQGSDVVPLDTYLLHADGAVRAEWKHKAVKRLCIYLGADEGWFMCRPWMEPTDE